MRLVFASLLAGAVVATPSSPGRLHPAASMNVPRAVQTETALQDGQVLVAGGCTVPGCDLGSPGSDTAEIFDPKSGRFRPAGKMHGSRDDHVAVLLRDGSVLLAGGWGDRRRPSARDD